MKWIKYKIVCNVADNILLEKRIGYSAANLAIAQAEAYNGQYTVEEDATQTLTEDQFKLDAQVVSSAPAVKINANKSKIYKTLGFAIIDVSMTITPGAPIMSESDTIPVVKMIGITPSNVAIPFYFQLNVSNVSTENEFIARLQTGGTITLWPTKALIDKGGYDIDDTITVRVTGVYPLSESEISES